MRAPTSDTGAALPAPVRAPGSPAGAPGFFAGQPAMTPASASIVNTFRFTLEELILEPREPSLPRRIGIESEHHADAVLQVPGGAGKVPLTCRNGARLIGVIGAPSVGFETRTKRLGNRVSARIAVPKPVVAAGACADLFLPNQIDDMGEAA